MVSLNTFVQKASKAAVDGFCDGFMAGGIMSGFKHDLWINHEKC